MTYTKHGHHIPGTPKSDKGDVVEIGCGGLSTCDACIQESAHVYYNQIQSTKMFIAELPLDTQIYVEVRLEVQHEKRMVDIGKALVDIEALKKIGVDATPDHQLTMVVASHFRFEGKE